MPVAMLALAPAALNACVVGLGGVVSWTLGREPNPETAFLLMPVPLAFVLLRLADDYSLTGRRRRVAVLAGVVASIVWWAVGLLAVAAAAQAFA
jgi:hypothetical protein